MEWKELFYDIFRTLNPDSYDELTSREFKHAFRYFSFILLLSVIAMFVLSIPGFFAFPNYWQEKVSSMNTFDVNMSFSVNSPIQFFGNPPIYFANNVSITNESYKGIVITPDAMYFKKLYFFGKLNIIPIDKDLNLKSSETLKHNLLSLIIFILPSLFFWSIIFFTIYFWMIILFTFIITMIVVFAFRSNLTWKSVLKSCIYASTILISLQLILLPFFRLFFIPLVAYWILIFLVIFLLRDEARGHTGGHSKHLNETSHSSFSSNKSHMEAQDSYDVDAHGNIKSGAKRKRNFEEENDGYVEIK